MPQMSSMFWLVLSVAFFICLMLFIIFFYYQFNAIFSSEFQRSAGLRLKLKF